MDEKRPNKDFRKYANFESHTYIKSKMADKNDNICTVLETGFMPQYQNKVTYIAQVFSLNNMQDQFNQFKVINKSD